MGGRGARYGVSDKGKKYGTEYKTVYQVGRIKFIEMIDDRPQGKKPLKPKSATAPLETKTRGRGYVTLGANGEPSTISLYRNGKRVRQIDLDHPHKKMQPHTHRGYYHNEKGDWPLTKREEKLVDFVNKAWQNRPKSGA